METVVINDVAIFIGSEKLSVGGIEFTPGAHGCGPVGHSVVGLIGALVSIVLGDAHSGVVGCRTRAMANVHRMLRDLCWRIGAGRTVGRFCVTGIPVAIV
jgi:hypothetical protein